MRPPWRTGAGQGDRDSGGQSGPCPSLTGLCWAEGPDRQQGQEAARSSVCASGRGPSGMSPACGPDHSPGRSPRPPSPVGSLGSQRCGGPRGPAPSPGPPPLPPAPGSGRHPLEQSEAPGSTRPRASPRGLRDARFRPQTWTPSDVSTVSISASAVQVAFLSQGLGNTFFSTVFNLLLFIKRSSPFGGLKQTWTESGKTNSFKIR